MTLIAVDPGRSTGIAWGTEHWIKAEGVRVLVGEPGGTVALAGTLKDIFLFEPQRYVEATVVIEKPVPMKGSIAFGSLSQIVGAVKSVCDWYEVPWFEVAPATWKSKLRWLGEGPKKAKPREYVAHWLRVIREQLPIPAVTPLTVDEIDAVLIWWVWSNMQKEEG